MGSAALFDLSEDEAQKHLLQSSAYFDLSMPEWFNFGPILEASFEWAQKLELSTFEKWKPQNEEGVNYLFLNNKDGGFAWRPFELINPLIYAKAVDLITTPENWQLIKDRLKEFEGGVVECCSIPVVSTGKKSDVAEQILKWWHRIEQRSLELSLEYSHVAITDVSNCYPSKYTHSISWAFHDYAFIKTKNNKADPSLLGNQLDRLISLSRQGQTNGIPQASTLSHILAEFILGYCDREVSQRLGPETSVRILRYRDDYRVFGNSDSECRDAVKIVSEELHKLGMRLGAAKTSSSDNIVELAVKKDKLSALELQISQKTLQKVLLIIHKFSILNPNSGALKVLLKDFLHLLTESIGTDRYQFENKRVLISILTDLIAISPSVMPPAARAISLILGEMGAEQRAELFDLISSKAKKLSNSGYLEVWLQRMALPNEIDFESEEALCGAVSNDSAGLWNFNWVKDVNIRNELEAFAVVSKVDVEKAPKTIAQEEIDDFWQDNPSF